MAIITTVGGATSNSYVTVGEFESYVELHPFYSDVTLPDDEQYLRYSTMLMDTLITWSGDVASDTQALQFPRVSPKLDGLSIPTVIKNAQCELIIWLTQNTAMNTESNEFKVIEFGEVRIEPNNETSKSLIPELVESMISSLGSVKKVGNSTLSSVRVVRG